MLGVMVLHEQLGLGKIIREVNDECEVVFLFFWPAVRVKMVDLAIFNPSDEFQSALQMLVRGAHKASPVDDMTDD